MFLSGPLQKTEGMLGKVSSETASYSATNKARAGTGKDAAVQGVLDVRYTGSVHSTGKVWTTWPEDTRE